MNKFIFMLIMAASLIGANNPIELGKVSWLRSMDEAIEQSKAEHKDILILFQEVPGCATCSRYGNSVLSHPLIVETIQERFVPLAIYNNKGGEDRKVLDYFDEPTWNNPVVRIVDNQKRDMTTRLNGNYSSLGLVQQMILALQSSKKKIPAYLSLLEQELSCPEDKREEIVLSMFCFWTGEKELGAIDGVLYTEPGFMNNREVVKVIYNPLKVQAEVILNIGAAKQCADRVFTDDRHDQKIAEKIIGADKVNAKDNYKIDREPKYYLSRTPYKYVPMTKIQATKANSLIGQGLDPTSVLSSSQVQLMDTILSKHDQSWDNLIGKDFISSWNKVQKKLQE